MTASHQPEPGEPLRLKSGDEVTVGRRSERWPAWVMCHAADGMSGWVPEELLAREAPEFDQATVLHDYDATELEVPEGEVLEVLSELGGWLWSRTEDGRLGWVPVEETAPA
jgi:Variant SH3 domain